jgi:hypothetical protein
MSTWIHTIAWGSQLHYRTCSVCGKHIEGGSHFRFRERSEADPPWRFVNEHRECSADDPQWAILDQREAQALEWRKKRSRACRKFSKEWHTDLDEYLIEDDGYVE